MPSAQYRRPGFSLGFASACALVAFLSFVPTYWLPLEATARFVIEL